MNKELKQKLNNEASLYCQEYATLETYDSVHKAYIFSAEPREKQLQEKDKKIAELEAQIEKMKIKWHDLKKDPTDLPKDCKTLCICLSDFGSKYEPVPQVCVGYCDSLGWSDYMGSSLYSTVRYWCELPQF